jgi:hypothetical protein
VAGPEEFTLRLFGKGKSGKVIVFRRLQGEKEATGGTIGLDKGMSKDGSNL